VAVAETNPDIVYIGGGETQLRGSITQGDGVYKTTDGGKTWRSLGLKETQAISRIRVHPTNPDIVYVAALGHPYGDNEERGVFKSVDGGNTWKKVLYISPKAGAADLIIDRTNPKILYASTWQVYRKTWKMWGGGPDCKLWKSENAGETDCQFPSGNLKGEPLDACTPLCLCTSLCERAKKPPPGLVILKNILALIAPAHDRIHRTGKFQSQLAWHGQRIGSSPLLVKRKKSFSTV